MVARRVLRLAVIAAVIALATQIGSLGQVGRSAVSCAGNATLNIVAHPDDDLIFLSPDLLHDVQGGRCVRTVFVTAGDSGDGMGYGSIRESGIKAAYAQMAGVANAWTTADAGIAGHPTPQLTLTGMPTVSIVFLRLPNAQSDGTGYPDHNGDTVEKLWDGTITQLATVDGASSYTKSGLTAALTSLMTAFQPTAVHTQDYLGTYGDGDHPDHHVAAYFARAAHLDYTTAHTLTGYLDYNSSARPQNVFDPDLTAKRAAFTAYAGFDLICGTPPACTTTEYDKWILRQYTVGSETGGGGGPPPAPVVSGLSPASGVVGSSVSVSGSNLSGASAVKFNGVSASFSVVSGTSITATVPVGATSGPVSVTTPGGTGSSPSAFTVTTGGGGSGYRSVVVADGPVAYWRLGESSGVVAADASGHGFGGSYVGSPSLGQAGALAGDSDSSVGLNGSSQFVEVPFAAALNPSVFSVEAWVYPTGGAGSFRSVLTSRDTPTRGLSLYASDANTWQAWLGTGASYLKLIGPAVAMNTWTHLVVTFNGSSASLYVNGSLAASTGLAYSPNAARPLRIGAGRTESAGGDYLFPGRIDEVAVYGTALSAAAVTTHYQAAQTP